MKIVILGYIVKGPLGGLAWHHFQYVYGLKQMGHEVLFMEDSEDFPCCYNPETYMVGEDPAYGLQFIQNLFALYNLQHNWCYYDAHTGKWYGQSKQKVLDFCAAASAVINLSGVNPLRDWWTNIPNRILVDTDPVFTQVKHLTDEKAMALAKCHTHFFTFGENFGKPGCSIPDDRLPWQPTRQPVCIDLWKVSPAPPNANWTTVMQWDSYKNALWEGNSFGMKSQSFQEYVTLPNFIQPEKLELALGSVTAPKQLLEKENWLITDPFIATSTPHVFQDYIASSKGEWTVSKHGYVVTNSGWFSERTLNYMMTGKPVIIQNTGFSDFLPIGKGILTFSSLEDAVEKIREVSMSYNDHCLQARQIALTYFEAEEVLARLLKAQF